MLLRIVRFAALLLTALGLSMGLSHTLELPPKMHYDAELYTAVTSTLYRFYGWIGAILQLGSLIAVALLCRLVYGRRSFPLTLAALLALALSLGLWAAIVQPVNTQWAQVLHASPSTAPAAYLRLRPRWEYGHVAAFIAWLSGFVCLALSMQLEILPQNKPDAGTVAQRSDLDC
jgi:hypothetical protein